MTFRNQKTRFALRIPPSMHQALLPLIEKEDPDTAAHFATVINRAHGGDVEVPMTGVHLVHLARVAGQHFNDIPHTHSLFNAIAAVTA
jgi:hypothetical protein